MPAAVALQSLPRKLSTEVVFKAKPSPPITPSPSPEGAIGRDIQPPVYAPVQHQTWRTLYDRQSAALPGRVCDEYLAGRAKLGYERERIPRLADLSERLRACTGWQCVRVEGYVPEATFFLLLAQKLFPCTDFLRHPTELEYTPAPDMFHDLMGHLPMIANPRFASFFQKFGRAGINARNAEDTVKLGRIYWYTVEFGLINPTAHAGAERDSRLTKIYGAGISSSVGEIAHALSDAVRKTPFDIERVADTPVEIHHMQEELFEIASFDELEQSFEAWAAAQGLMQG
ncbi:MAG: phenylalanine 4-monooxygenase [Chloracidobacterium sp. CP2_5A]|nr:MAG: phenylalanine 4-monooxygenase [Chloracidobacterium sp. CP2_5A]